jgi:molecular chaperone GrpE
VLDSFDMAISHDLTSSSPEQLVAGMRVIRDELLRSVGRFGVVVISPAVGEEFQPGRHEAIMQKAEEGVEPGHIVRTFQAGYVLGERVLRPAKVAVAP